MEYVFGIDVGGTTVKIGLFTTDGTLVDKWEIPTNTSNGGKSHSAGCCCKSGRKNERTGH